MKTYFVFIVECSDKSYYVGITQDLYAEIERMNLGANPKCYTFNRLPLTLKFYEVFSDVREALAAQRQLRGWSRKKKEALFDRNWDRIIELAKNRKDGSSTSSEPQTVTLDP